MDETIYHCLDANSKNKLQWRNGIFQGWFVSTLLGFNVVADGAGPPGTAYTYLTAADTDSSIHTGAKTTGSGTDLDIYMRLNPAGTEAADTYTSTVTFTIVGL